jgi:hypothetical protein
VASKVPHLHFMVRGDVMMVVCCCRFNTDDRGDDNLFRIDNEKEVVQSPNFNRTAEEWCRRRRHTKIRVLFREASRDSFFCFLNKSPVR